MSAAGGGPPEDALERLAESLRGDDPVISAQVQTPGESPALGMLAASGPRAGAAPGEYSFLVEAIREGYLLHYSEGRIVRGADPDLALLAGDYLYATGLERLATLGDTDAVRELSDLISLSAQIHDYRSDGHGDEGRDYLAAALWLATAVAVGCGDSDRHQRAKGGVRRGGADSAAELWESAAQTADERGIGTALESAADAIGFAPQRAGSP